MGFPNLLSKWKPKLRPNASSNSVHPSSDGHDQHQRSISKVMKILGPVSQRDYLEIDELLKKSRSYHQSGEEEEEEEEEEYDSFEDDDASDTLPDQDITSALGKLDKVREVPLENLAKVLPALNPQAHFAGTDNRRCESDICVRDFPRSLALEQSRSSVDSVKQRYAFASSSDRTIEITGRRRNITGKFRRVAVDMPMTSSGHGSCGCGLHPCEHSKESNSANDSGNVFPLPLPMYQLPTPGISMLNNLKSTAHPLPQPPSPRSLFPRNSFLPKSLCDANVPEKSTERQVPGRLQTTSYYMSNKLTQKTMQSDLASTNLQHKTLLPLPLPNRSGSPTVRRFSLSPLTPPSMAPQSPRPLFKKAPKKWQKGKILGSGSFGTVYEGFNPEDGSFFAVKVSSKEDISPEIQQEVDVLSKLEHPNIVSYHGCSIEDNRLCIFLELVRMGSLDANLRKYKRFEVETIRRYTRQILLGLDYLHTKNTVHRDIKCSNILVDVNGQVKLSDFGIAKQIDNCLIYSMKGTPLYMAPEVITAPRSSYSFPADIWSLGCTVFEMAEGKPPWSDSQGFSWVFKLVNGEQPPMPKGLSPDGKDFICRCLKFNPQERPTAAELLQHPFVANAPIPEHFVPWSPPPSPLLYGQSESSKTTWNSYGNDHLATSGHCIEAFQRAETLS